MRARARLFARTSPVLSFLKGDNFVSGKDLFADDAFDGTDKYRRRNEQTLRAERADELDARILKFVDRSHDLTWAQEAEGFCATETIQNEDVFDLSNEAHRLPKIKAEAALILENHAKAVAEEKRLAAEAARAEAARIAEEKRRAEQAAREKAAKKAEEERLARLAAEQAKRDAIAAAAKRFDDAVVLLQEAPRSRYWCDEVRATEAEFKELPRESRVLCRKLPVLEKLLPEVKNVEAAAAFDEKVMQYKSIEGHRRDMAWCEEVLKLSHSLPAAARAYIQKEDVLSVLLQQANERKIEFQNRERRAKEEALKQERKKRVATLTQQLRGYEDTLKRAVISLSDLEDVQNRVQDLRKDVNALGFSISEYQADFTARLDRLQEGLQERIARTYREIERRRIEQERAARKKKLIAGLLGWGLPLLLCIIGIFVFADAQKYYDLSQWCLGLTVGLAIDVLRCLLALKRPTVSSAKRVAADMTVSGVAVLLLLLQYFHMAAGLAFGVMIFAIFVRSEAKHTDFPVADMFSLMISGSVFSVALAFIVARFWVAGIWGALVAGILIAALQIVFSTVALNVEEESWLVFTFVFTLVSAIVSFVLVFFTRELCFFALPILIVETVAGFVFVCMGFDEEMIGTVSGLATLFVCFALFWSFSVWGAQPVSVVEEGTAVVYRLDRSEGTVVVPDMGGDTYWLKRVHAPKADTIAVENGVSVIGEKAFSRRSKRCKTLEVVYLPSSVEKIERNAFADLKNLTTVYIGYDENGKTTQGDSRLEVLEYGVFADTKVSKIYFNGSYADWMSVTKKKKSDNSKKQWDHEMGEYTVYFSQGGSQYYSGD